MRTTLFLCYSHEDERFRDELMTHLAACDDIDVWSDQAIPAGVEWLPEIDRALAEVDAAVIIVSPDLLKSKFVKDHELPKILERHRRDGMRPMWLHYRPSLYERSPLAKFQCLHDALTPLSKLTRAAREATLVRIVEKILEPQPQRAVANALRTADAVFTAEHGVPSIAARIRPDRIDMKVRGVPRPTPFLTYAELNAKLSPQDRQVLRAHERAMRMLVHRWSQLHPASRTTSATQDAQRELVEVRQALTQELDAALGFIEQLGYGLDDHYQAVRHAAVAGQAVSAKVARTPTVEARFVLDDEERPQYSRKARGYWLQAWLEGAPERTASVVWRMHPSIAPSQETVDTRPLFRKDFVAHGDFTLRADLRTKNRAPIRTLSAGLHDALSRQYSNNRSAPVQEALEEIAEN
jgi:hypothetical protein